MGFFDWKDEYNVKIESIDSQHKKILMMIDRIYRAMVERKTLEIMPDIVNDMIDYSIHHFNTEEEYMDQYNYPDSMKHKNEHIFFKEKAIEFKERLEQEDLHLSPKITHFLKDWLIDHILKLDRGLAAHLISKGVK